MNWLEIVLVFVSLGLTAVAIKLLFESFKLKK